MDFDAAISGVLEASDSTISGVHWSIANCYVAQGMYDRAFDQLRRLGDPEVERLWEAYQEGCIKRLLAEAT